MNDVSLKEYIEARIDSLKLYFEARFKAEERSIELAKADMDRRMDAANRLREQIDKQNEDNSKALSNYVNRTEHDYVLKAIQEIKETLAKAEGKASQSSVTTVTFMAIASLLLGSIGLIIHILVK